MTALLPAACRSRAYLGLVCLGLFRLIFSHKILFILPILYYLCSQPTRAIHSPTRSGCIGSSRTYYYLPKSFTACMHPSSDLLLDLVVGLLMPIDRQASESQVKSSKTSSIIAYKVTLSGEHSSTKGRRVMIKATACIHAASRSLLAN